MDLAAAFEDVDALALRLHWVAVEIGGALLKLREVLHALHCPLRAEETLDVDTAQRRSIDAMPVCIGADVTDGVRRGVRVAGGMAGKTSHALVGLKAAAIIGGVELCLGKRRHEQSQTFDLLRIQIVFEELLEV